MPDENPDAAGADPRGTAADAVTAAADAPAAPNTAARDRLRRLEGRGSALAKGGGFINVLVAITADRAGFANYPAALALVVAVAVDTALLGARILRTGRVSRAWATADLGFVCALLLANAAVVRPQATQTWAYFAYPYSLVSTMLYGFVYEGFAAVAGAVCAVAAACAAGCVLNGPVTANIVPNTLSLLVVAPAAWLVARELRTASGELDRARTAAEYSAAALSRERERTYHRRILHDRVLQTLELLDRTGQGVPEQLREHIASEAAWLRHLVETGTEREQGDLLTGLDALAATAGRLGLRVRVRAARLGRADSVHRALPPEHVGALLGAAGEALANVLKHAGVVDAVLHATADESSVTVTVADAGRGFDPDRGRQGTGTGIARSIAARMGAVGGLATVDSAAGLGTRVVLTVPVARGAAEPDAVR